MFTDLLCRPMQSRFGPLCRQVASKRRTAGRLCRPSPATPRVPRARIEQALEAELVKDSFTSLKAVAASLGLRSKRRFYKDFFDLRCAIVAKNNEIRKRRLGQIEHGLRTPLTEEPPPTVTELAQRAGFRDVGSMTSRFPELAMALRARRKRVQLTKRERRVNEAVLRTLKAALLENPAPSLSAGRKRNFRPQN